MHSQLFFDLLDVAWDDFRAEDPQALGIAVMLFRRGPDGTLEVRLGSNASADMVEHAIGSLVHSWMRGEDRCTVHKRPRRRKTV